jgi:SulP family sulfate permease
MTPVCGAHHRLTPGPTGHSPRGAARIPAGVRLIEMSCMSALLSAARRPTRPEWLSPRVLRIEVLAGLVVALALIPEASLVKEHGLGYLIAAVILGGLIQVLLAVLGVAKLMRFIPRSVMVGFVNALAILIFTAQVPHLIAVPWLVYPMVAVALAIMGFVPRLTTAVPAPLVAIITLTVFTVVAHVTVPNVGAEGTLPDSLPVFGLPDVPFTLATLQLVAPFALGIALVGLMESLMTAKLVDDITDTHSNKTRESWGQGVANIITGFFGGMGGCAMIGQTMINVKASGARTRLSTFLAGVFLLVLVVALGDVVALIPMAALVAVMIIVSVSTFDWHSVAPATLKRMPLGETTVMVTTVTATLVSHNLAIGVVLGVLAAMVIFARRVAHLAEVTSVIDPDETTRFYSVHGELFFASSNDLVYQFDYANDPAKVVIDLSRAHIRDASSVAALDAITTKYAARGTHVEIVGLNEASAAMHDNLAGKLNVGH